MMDFGGKRESFRSYLKREVFVDPEAEAKQRALQREADIAREAELAMRGTPGAGAHRGPSLPGSSSRSAQSAGPQDGSVEVEVQRRLTQSMYNRRAMTGSSRLAAKGSSQGQVTVAGWQAEHKSGDPAPDRSVTWAAEGRLVRSGKSSSLGGSLRRAGAGVASSPSAVLGGSAGGGGGRRRRIGGSRAGDTASVTPGRSPSLDRPKRRRRGAGPPAGPRPFRQSGHVHHDPSTGSVTAGGDRGPAPKKASTLVRMPKEVLPKLVGDDRLGSVPVETLRRSRWDELRWLHALLVRQGKQPSGLAEYLSLEGGVRRTLFIVNMTGFAGVPDRIIGEHASALFKSFDVSRTGVVDPRELQCCLRVVDKPHDTPSQILQWCIQFYAVKRRSDGLTCIPSDDLLFLLFMTCITYEEEAALKRFMPELTTAMEKFTGDPWPKLISRHSLSLALADSPKYCDEFRRQCMNRLPEDIRLGIMRRAAEEASLVVQARERALQIQKAALFLREKLQPRMLRDNFFAWAEYAQERAVMRGIDEMCDRQFRKEGLKRAIRRWRRKARLPRINAIAVMRCPRRRALRMMKRWKSRMRYFPILKKIEDERYSEELALRAERAYKWAEGWRLRRRVEVMRGIFYAMKVSLRAYQRKKAAAKWLRKKRLMRTFMTWKREVIETIKQRIDLKLKSDRAQEELSARLKAIEDEERAAREAEKRRQEEAKQEQEAYDEIMRKQRARAAVVMAYDRSAAAMAQKRAFERQRLFQKMVRDGARRWERDFPQLLEEELDKKRAWLRGTPEGREEFENHVTYTSSAVELAVPTEPSKKREGDEEAEGQDTKEAAGGGGGEGPPDMRGSGMASAVGADAAMRAAEKIRRLHGQGGGDDEDESGFAMPTNDIERLDDHGLDPKDRWQLVFRFGDLCRAWVKSDTGEEVGPASNRVGLTRITRKIAERIALENWEGRKARQLAKDLDSNKQERYHGALMDAYAAVIQRWFKAYRRIRMWKQLREETLRMYRRAQIRIKAVRRKAAVLSVQCFWRSVKARRRVLRLLLGRWCLMGDFSSHATYYMNMHSLESLWDEPGLIRVLSRFHWQRARARRVLMMKPSAREMYFDANGGTLQQVLGLASEEEAEEFARLEAEHEEEAEQAKEAALREREETSGSEGGAALAEPASGAGADRPEEPASSDADGSGGASTMPQWYKRVLDLAIPMSKVATERLPEVLGDLEEREQWGPVIETGGTYFQHHTSGEVRQYAPGGYIICEECKSQFATCYTDGMDKVLCSQCFLAMHSKPSRIATQAYVVPRGRYWHPYQAPDHVPRTPFQLLGDEFCQPLVDMAKPKPDKFKKYFVYDAT